MFFMRRDFCVDWYTRVIQRAVDLILEVDEKRSAVNSTAVDLMRNLWGGTMYVWE